MKFTFPPSKWLRIAVCIILCQMAGLIGSIATFPNIATWYASLAKPAVVPPNWLFGPVWLTLYTLMGIALWLVWDGGIMKKKNSPALAFFTVQLMLNGLWSFLFFGWHMLLASLAEIIVMWVFILLSIITFYKIDKRAGLILVPYICWVTIAATLNYYLWVLNP
jgi:tryptophan-rich sensory protein